jgi:hypothetical protein
VSRIIITLPPDLELTLRQEAATLNLAGVASGLTPQKLIADSLHGGRLRDMAKDPDVLAKATQALKGGQK